VINAARAQQRRAERQAPADFAVAEELATLQRRKADAERLRAERAAAGQPWPTVWEAEYQRILTRINELESE
jgi:hypothetical protein